VQRPGSGSAWRGASGGAKSSVIECARRATACASHLVGLVRGARRAKHEREQECPVRMTGLAFKHGAAQVDRLGRAARAIASRRPCESLVSAPMPH